MQKLSSLFQTRVAVRLRYVSRCIVEFACKCVHVFKEQTRQAGLHVEQSWSLELDSMHFICKFEYMHIHAYMHTYVRAESYPMYLCMCVYVCIYTYDLHVYVLYICM